MLNSRDWYGLDGNGEKIRISHDEFMDWANRNDKSFSVGWGNAVRQGESRLVRGDHVAEARKAGWDDLAKELEEFARH